MISQYQITFTPNQNIVLARITEGGCYQIAKFMKHEVEVALQLVRDFGQLADVHDYTDENTGNGYTVVHTI